MKQLIFLYLALLGLSCLLPLSSYAITGQHTTSILAAQSGTNSNSSAAQNLTDFWQTNNETITSSDTASHSDNTNLTDLNLGEQANPSTTQDATQNSEDSLTLPAVLLWDTGTSTLLTVSMRDYLIGSVASELAISWPDEALKAQAIACHSYLLYCQENPSTDTSAQEGAYRSVDPARREGYMTDEVLQSYWGDAYDENYARLSALVDEVLDVVVLYEGEAAATSYFSCSNGMTETSEAVWGQALPYLVSVDSSEDVNAEGYATSVSYTAAQVESIFFTVFGISTQDTDPSAYFSSSQYDAAGYVSELSLCGYTVAGTTLRTAFALRSSCFSVAYSAEDDLFTFVTYGYGHGVGLSQWGAKFRAQAGETYASILAHYFPETTLGSARAL